MTKKRTKPRSPQKKPANSCANSSQPAARKRRITLTLPYPPTLNKYWRRVGTKTLLSRTARTYHQHVAAEWLSYRLETNTQPLGPAKVKILLKIHPPDRRRRDIDNILKALFDAIEKAGIIDDDSQIRILKVIFEPPTENGKAIITITPLTQ